MYQLLCSNRLDNLTALFEQGKSLEEHIVDELEMQLVVEPNNVEARARLLGYYLSPKMSAPSGNRYRKHVIWVVQNLPSHALAAWCTCGLLPEDDPQLFSDLENIWRKKVDEEPTNFDVLFNASVYYETAGLYEMALKLGTAARKLHGQDSILDKRNSRLRKYVAEDAAMSDRKQK